MTQKHILVSGGSGFLGRHLVSLLKSQGHYVERVRDDLTDRDFAAYLFNGREHQFDEVYHLAGYNGGIAFNAAYPADIFYRNTVMGLNLLDAACRARVGKILCVVASCAYPDAVEYPYDFVETTETIEMAPHGILHEDDFLRGRPHPSVACHGYAKRNLQLACSFYRQQYGVEAVCVCPTTLYGPGDSYDPQRTKLVGGMVKRFCDALQEGKEEVTCWGSGEPMRELLYVEDCAELLVQAMEKWHCSNKPLNLGTGQELTVKEVAETVAARVGYSGKIGWDTSRPDGQLRKRLDTSLQFAALGHFHFTPLVDGLDRTIADYRKRFHEDD